MFVRWISAAVLVMFAACGGGEGQAAFSPTGPSGTNGNRLVFTAQPAAAVTAGAPFAVQVAVRDASGGTIPNATNNVTASITSGTGTSGAVLGGTRSVAAVNGIAAFNNLTIDRAGAGFTLTASANGLTSGTSSPITVNP